MTDALTILMPFLLGILPLIKVWLDLQKEKKGRAVDQQERDAIIRGVEKFKIASKDRDYIKARIKYETTRYNVEGSLKENVLRVRKEMEEEA